MSFCQKCPCGVIDENRRCDTCGDAVLDQYVGDVKFIPPHEGAKFVELVKAMRASQRAYFKTRDRAALEESKALEREVDAELAAQKEIEWGER